ncbi:MULTISPECIES: DUF1491 family protein [unclassified Devosia]|jgi:hypothetical protein|uniref:DUF1491 family protein n=1 Tax=unclassified Devosia TaxID=196773 RepID=UPI00086ABAF8|nr:MULTISPECIES: DUF1491 family protein [unclassified Devosia]MBN9360374.1 DUF1491 family protein [Devosia sp.]ODS96022.1 MAG: hypothetical protein ABS47_02000 [Devosia sp. SCN 66-27]OJX22387.1 MAG: hypothetical protein BGO83_16295 [Devosia sp. 66-14]
MFRTDLWVSAFVRRHNDIGHLCVVSRRGDPIAGQIFVEVDHLNGEVSLYTPAPAASLGDNDEDRVFQLRFDHVEPDKVRDRIAREQDFDPDLWVVSLELRSGELGLEVAK